MPGYCPPIARECKQAVEVEGGGPISAFVADTVGRVNPLSWPSLITTGRAMHSPRLYGRQKKHRETAELLAQAEPEALEGVVVRLGGGDVVDDLLWKKERGGYGLPWYKQIGGRVMQNPHTSALGKLLHYPSTLAASLGAPLLRASHYNPGTNAATVYQDDPVVTQHELGHAIDDHKLTGKPSSSFWKRQLQGAGRDIHSLLYRNLLGRLEQEATANVQSGRALEKSLHDRPQELASQMKRRWQVLPAAYGSMLGIPAASMAYALPQTRPYTLPIGLGTSVLGALAGKLFGMGVAPSVERSYKRRGQREDKHDD